MKRKISAIAMILILCILLGTVVSGCGEKEKKSEIKNLEITTEKVEDTEKKKEESALLVIEEKTEEVVPETTPEEIVAPQEEAVKPENNNLIQSLDFGYEDATMLEKISIAEAGGESVECMAQVMLVVLNRTWSDEFPDSIEAVIFEENQFTPIINGSYDRAVPNEKSRQALDMVMGGWNESQNALYFESCSGSSWHSRNLEFLFQVDTMRFYK